MIKPDYYWYEEILSKTVIVGIRGGSEYRVNLWDFEKAYMRIKLRIGHELTPEEVYKLCVVESQYVDFEPVLDIKLLS